MNIKIYVNIDTEKYDSLQQIIQALDKFKGEFKNVGTASYTSIFVRC